MSETHVPVDDATLLQSGAMVLLGHVLKDHGGLGVRITYREAGFDVEFYDATEPILRETAPVLRHALLAALNRMVDEWLPGRPRS